MTKPRAASSTSVGRRVKRETVTFLMLIDIHLERYIDRVSADSRPTYRPSVDLLLSVTSCGQQKFFLGSLSEGAKTPGSIR